MPQNTKRGKEKEETFVKKIKLIFYVYILLECGQKKDKYISIFHYNIHVMRLNGQRSSTN